MKNQLVPKENDPKPKGDGSEVENSTDDLDQKNDDSWYDFWEEWSQDSL
jgi:hypothetical protein